MTTLAFRGNQWNPGTCTEPLPAIVGMAARDPMLDALRKDAFLNAMAVIRAEAPRQYLVVLWHVLLRYPISEVAAYCGTTEDNIRMAKMRGLRALRRNAGAWVDQFIEAIHDAR